MNQEMYKLAQSVIGKLISVQDGDGKNDHLTMNIWEWPQGVAAYSMYKVYKKTGDPAFYAFLESWYATHIAKGLPPKNVNTTAPMLTMACLCEETKNETYRALVEEWAHWVMWEMPRTQEGGLQHITSDSINLQQLWDDTLFMTVLFLYKAGRLLGDPAMVEEARYQFLLHIKYLHSPKTGLWYHGFTFEGNHHFGEAYWARGNSWFTSGGVEFYELLTGDAGDADCTARLVRETFVEQCAALAKLQDEKTGLWHTLLDHPDSYLETSASAGIAYGLLKGVRLGLLPAGFASCARKAVEGVLAQIDADGTVQGVSYGTPMGHDLDFYRTVPVCPTAYGQGLTFLMLTELI